MRLVDERRGGGIADSALDPREFVRAVVGGIDARRMAFRLLRARNGDDVGDMRNGARDTTMQGA